MDFTFGAQGNPLPVRKGYKGENEMDNANHIPVKDCLTSSSLQPPVKPTESQQLLAVLRCTSGHYSRLHVKPMSVTNLVAEVFRVYYSSLFSSFDMVLKIESPTPRVSPLSSLLTPTCLKSFKRR